MAAKQDIKFNIPQKGLNRDQYNLGESDYSTLLNGLFDGTDTGTFTITNEMSNVLSSKFKQGFKVINATNDVYSNTTYFFLVNPTTGVGEFGQIKNVQQIVNINDVALDCEDCVKHLDLGQPLEGTTQTPLNVYQTLLTDECHTTSSKKGFNFSIDFPIKKTVIKNEKCGKTIYFTDDNNPPRYIILDSISQYKFTGGLNCGIDERVPTCLDNDKLLIFKKYNFPKLTPISIQLGGRLKLGVYEFLVAYCDIEGNEISEYFSITNPIQIFDKNNVTLTQEELRQPTNFSIKLDVSDLDERFTHYKIVVIQTTLDSVGATNFYVEGIHPINDNIVIYGGEQNKLSNIGLNDLLRENLYVRHVEFLTESNNSLIAGGITSENEINLQPIANLLGSFLKWQTHIATEDLYEQGVNSSLYLGYNRDETVPFSIRFLLEGGYKTALLPLIARTATDSDLGIIPIDNKDRKSIENNLNDCDNTERTKRYQFYNDATVEGSCTTDSLNSVQVQEPDEKICYIENIATSTSGSFTIDINEEYTGLKEYIEDNKGTCPQAFIGSDICAKLNLNNYSNQVCNLKAFTLFGAIGRVEIKINNLPYNIIFAGTLQQTLQNFVTTNSAQILATTSSVVTSNNNVLSFNGSFPLVTTENKEGNLQLISSGLFEGNCSAIELVPLSAEIEVTSIANEKFVGVEKNFPSEYTDLKDPGICNMYILNSQGESVPDTNFQTDFMPPAKTVYKRDFNFSNISCSTSESLQNINDTDTSIQGYYHTYQGSNTLLGLQTAQNALPAEIVGNGTFYDKIHKGALWFKSSVINREKFILEVSRSKDNDRDDDLELDAPNGSKIRMNVFSACSSNTPLYSQIIDLTQGSQIKVSIIGGDIIFENSSNTPFSSPFTSSNIFIALDVPIAQVTNAASTIVYRTAPTRGCFSIATREVEFSRATISWDNIVYRKKSVYRSLCTFNKPILQSCKAVPFKFGSFGYTESQEIYPDNGELYNSSILKIKPADIELSSRSLFEKNYVQGTTLNSIFTPTLDTSGNYIWKKDTANKNITDFRCRNIRHFKFPSNKISPFMYEKEQNPFAKSYIYPLGVTINERIINNFLDIAVKNSIISKEKRDNIYGYEIFRGDIQQDRSVIASGLLYDMRSYKENNEDVFYSSYPYNDLGKDILNHTNDQRNDFYSHPYGGIKNDKFTFHSPETDYTKTSAASELSVQGYMFGKSRGNFSDVEDHSKWVILTRKAKDLAGLLAGLEAATEAAVNLAQASEVFRKAIGTSSAINIPGIIIYGVAATATAASALVVNYGRYRYEWLKTFRDLGQPQNFASYYHSEGDYNYLKLLQEEGNQLRGINTGKYLKDGIFINTNEVTGERVSINNDKREASVYLELGKENTLEYPLEYIRYDNNTINVNNSSLTFASQNNACQSGKSDEVRRNIASPYIALKNYLPRQYGSINSIKWLPTGYRGDLRNPSTFCLPIFGGDTYITRHTLKRKQSLFNVTAFGLAPLTPFNYKFYSNIGKEPRFYVDYEVISDFTQKSALFPDIDYDLKFDCENRKANYFNTPSKFYLWYYGIPSFLTETRINTNLRNAEPTLKRDFFPNVGDIGFWTQEKNVSIKEPNYFFYNTIYSKPVTTVAYRTLADTFTQSGNDCRNDKPNGIMWSLPDNTENNISDPYLNFRPLDFYEFDSRYGKLKDLRTIERDQILVRQENATSLFNAVDMTIDDGKRAETRNLATAFARRPLTYSETDLGYGGTQSSQSVSCEFGHFHTDAKRGQVIQIPSGGQGMEEISSLIGGKPSGMRNWFKEHLPFKILKSKIANIQDLDVDNAYNGVGITMGYDSRFRRVLITKKDYMPKNDPCLKFEKGIGFYTDCGPEIISCPPGYTYNSSTKLCEKVNISTPICPTGYTYNQNLQTCTLIETSPANCQDEPRIPINVLISFGSLGQPNISIINKTPSEAKCIAINNQFSQSGDLGYVNTINFFVGQPLYMFESGSDRGTQIGGLNGTFIFTTEPIGTPITNQTDKNIIILSNGFINQIIPLLSLSSC